MGLTMKSSSPPFQDQGLVARVVVGGDENDRYVALERIGRAGGKPEAIQRGIAMSSNLGSLRPPTPQNLSDTAGIMHDDLPRAICFTRC
jgi:hypothetical protein